MPKQVVADDPTLKPVTIKFSIKECMTLAELCKHIGGDAETTMRGMFEGREDSILTILRKNGYSEHNAVHLSGNIFFK